MVGKTIVTSSFLGIAVLVALIASLSSYFKLDSRQVSIVIFFEENSMVSFFVSLIFFY